MTRPVPRLGPDLDGLADLRSALLPHRTDPRGRAARAVEAAPTARTMPGPRGSAGGRVVPDAEPVEDPTGDGSGGLSADALAGMELVARAQAGDADAFGELYDQYVDLVYRYIYYRVGTKALTEDLVSETFLRALRRISTFTWQGRDFAAWLVTIARNLIADHFKSGKYRLEVATADMLDADRATDGPEGEVLDAITNASLLDAVKQLNSEQQECVVLRFLQGMSVTETALAMDKTEGAIKALQYRAVRTLGRMLPKELLL
ncbi:MAG TPA: ECF subfamily RNA polymerase sigma factor, BldN family [Mycobacteriales bacterium]|nr:ECF subfamily RNA polymerase sigma factor, BldN family [Mycobacteriales bacterium]